MEGNLESQTNVDTLKKIDNKNIKKYMQFKAKGIFGFQKRGQDRGF